jgi:hypothetical protein
VASPQTEVKLTVGTRTYTLVHNLYAWAVAQRELSRPGVVPKLEEIRAAIGEESAIHIIATFYGMLQARHPQVATLQQASALLEEAGPAGVKALLNAMGVATPDPKDVAELEEAADRARPQAAQSDGASTTKTRRAGTGAGKNSRRAASA